MQLNKLTHKSVMAGKMLTLVFCITFIMLLSCESVLIVRSEPIMSSPEQNAPYITVRGTVPSVSGEPELNDIIRERVLEHYRQFEQDVDKAEAARRKNTVRQGNANSGTAETPEYWFDLAWKTGRCDAEYVSVLLDTQWFIGGAHTMEEAESFNWNVKQKRLVSVAEIAQIAGFDSLDTLAAHVRSNLEAKLNPDGTDKEVSRMITEGTARREKNYQVFLIEKVGVTFYFQRYQVAPGAYGLQSVKVNKNPPSARAFVIKRDARYG